MIRPDTIQMIRAIEGPWPLPGKQPYARPNHVYEGGHLLGWDEEQTLVFVAEIDDHIIDGQFRLHVVRAGGRPVDQWTTGYLTRADLSRRFGGDIRRLERKAGMRYANRILAARLGRVAA